MRWERAEIRSSCCNCNWPCHVEDNYALRIPGSIPISETKKSVARWCFFLHPWKISHGQSCPKKAVNKKMLKPTTWYRSRLLFCAFISVVPMHCPHKKGHVRCHSCLYRFWSEIKVWSHPRHIIIISPLKWWPWYHHTLHHLPRSISVSLGICQETRESALEVVIWAILMREGRGGLAASLSLKSVYFIGTLMFNNIYLYIYIYSHKSDSQFVPCHPL